MFEIAIMLLPVAAASGWYAASKHYKGGAKKPINEHDDYFKGLNYLLNEQPDKAIDVFIDLLEVDDETIEIHLALGTLFRQRGEVEKAIRLHQNLIARPQINKETRLTVLNELGLDYMRVGLLDRAETIFLELEKDFTYRVNATRQLLSIFQQEKEWIKAIDYATKLELIDARKHPLLLSHLHCEAALLFIKDGDSSLTKSHLKKALKIAPNNVRANVISAEIEASNGDYKKSLKFLVNTLEQDSRFAPVFLGSMIDCFDALEKPKKKFDFLAKLQASSESIVVISSFINVLLEQRSKEEASAFMRDKLLATSKLSYLKLYSQVATALPEELESTFLRKVIQQFEEEEELHFQCNQCGFSSVDLNWCCPSCRDWGTSVPSAM